MLLPELSHLKAKLIGHFLLCWSLPGLPVLMQGLLLLLETLGISLQTAGKCAELVTLIMQGLLVSHHALLHSLEVV